MPVEKEKPWHGLALECPVVLDATSPLYAMRCFSYKLRAHKPLFRGLSVATRGELSNAFRLSQAYAYILPHFSAQKLAKFQNKKAGQSLRLYCHSSFFGFFSFHSSMSGL